MRSEEESQATRLPWKLFWGGLSAGLSFSGDQSDILVNFKQAIRRHRAVKRRLAGSDKDSLDYTRLV
ncbi:hypothetical protein T12_9345 [Trichinella patagoniensis]|uniref:Uncharacterized protein n=1 Tax=Trichinella patagoniensis TaxID=990121 RepID=A0A0V0W128_9BILA|nr:hypothetical protein T12_9345 [Trichinella patagoniensis]